MEATISTRIVSSVAPSERTPRQVERAFRRLLHEGARLRDTAPAAAAAAG